MRSSLDFPRRFPNVLGSLILAALPVAHAVAQERAARPAATEAVVALGEKLFKDPRLSSTGKMSCATCHVPERAFTENKPLAVGQNNVTLGRNTPTIVGLASVREFPVGGSFARAPEMSSLEERVVLPLKDVNEMSGSVGEAVDRLAKDPQSVETFNAAFEESNTTRQPVGVTGDRLAAALAAYVRSLKPKESPGQAALAGSVVVLDEPAARGLELFKGEGRCQSCHSGPDLTDGKLHVVAKFKAAAFKTTQRPSPPVETKRLPKQVMKKFGEVAQAKEPVESRPATETRPEEPVMIVQRRGGGAYGPSMSFERQTLTLLDVKRTGPYFRDGSAATLADAVKRHVSDLREVGALRADVASNPLALITGTGPRHMGGKANTRDVLSPSAKAQVAAEDWIPPEVTAQQVDDLVAFLTTLSPAD